jgi:phosphate transport system protein
MSEERSMTEVDRQIDAIRSADPGRGVAAPLPHPTREAYDRELAEVKDNVLRMGTYVESAVRAAIDALRRHDADAALAVIEGDATLNEMQRKVTSMIAGTIATQQPVARDLRFLLTLDHVSYELERMGDHASSVAKQVRRLAPEPPLKDYVDLPEMGERAALLVHEVLRALVTIDVDQARSVAVQDDEIDRLYHRTFDDVIELMRTDAGNVERGARIILASHYIERIGDRATNIAEDIVFLATGEIEDLNP